MTGDLQQSLNLLVKGSGYRKDISPQPFLTQFKLLSEACYEPAFRFFVGLLDDPRATWREQAVRALSYYDSPLNETILNKVRWLLLNDDSEFVRFWAAIVIGDCCSWREESLMASLKSESSDLVRAQVFQEILELQGVSYERASEAHDMVRAGWFKASLKQVERIVVEWKAANPRVVFAQFQTFHSDLVKGKPLSARGVELLKANTNNSQGLNDYLEFVAQVGLCSVRNGFLWLVDPIEYAADLEQLLGLKPNQAAVFARTSFGRLLFVTREAIFYLVSDGGYFINLGHDYDFEFLLDWNLVNKNYLELFEFAAHREAVQALGAPEAFEVFGFESHVGNNGDDGTLERLGVHAHLKYLSHVHALRGWKQQLN